MHWVEIHISRLIGEGNSGCSEEKTTFFDCIEEKIIVLSWFERETSFTGSFEEKFIFLGWLEKKTQVVLRRKPHFLIALRKKLYLLVSLRLLWGGNQTFLKLYCGKNHIFRLQWGENHIFSLISNSYLLGENHTVAWRRKFDFQIASGKNL